MGSLGEVTTLIGALAGIVTVVLALLGYVSSQSKALRETIMSGDKASVVEAARLCDGEGKQRHSMANVMQTQVVQVRNDVETLKREAVRRDDLNALDVRWGQSLSRLESKLDRQAEQLTELAALKATMASCTERLGEVMKRLDTRAG